MTRFCQNILLLLGTTILSTQEATCFTIHSTPRTFTTLLSPTLPYPSSTFPSTSSTSTSTALSAIKRRGGRRQPQKKEIAPPMNNEITQSQLRVSVLKIDPSSFQEKEEQLGILTKEEALSKSKELGVDLVLINTNSDPPVAKIVDYSKYRYNREKKAKAVKKNSKSSELKEVKMSYKIDTHDYGVRIKNASKFLTQGNRVKCTVQFRGREVQHDKLGIDLLYKMESDMTKICVMDKKPKREGRNLSCILSPRPEVTKAYNDKKRAEEKEKKRKRNKDKAAKSAGGGEDGSETVAKADAAKEVVG